MTAGQWAAVLMLATAAIVVALIFISPNTKTDDEGRPWRTEDETPPKRRHLARLLRRKR